MSGRIEKIRELRGEGVPFLTAREAAVLIEQGVEEKEAIHRALEIVAARAIEGKEA